MAIRQALIGLLIAVCTSSIGVAQDFKNTGAQRLRSQINVQQSSGDSPFINLLNSTIGWQRADGLYAGGDEIDVDGYPNASATNFHWTASFDGPNQLNRPGNYAFIWTGKGSIQFAETGNNGGFNHISCTGQNGSGSGLGECDNRSCSNLTGSISGTVLTVTVASTWTGGGSGNCNLVVGQPISGSGVNDKVIIAPTNATGQIPSIIIGSGSSGATCGGGACTGTGGTGTYLLNQSSTVAPGSTIVPGAKAVYSITGEDSSLQGLYSVKIKAIGTTPVSRLAMIYLGSVNTCNGMTDEQEYWGGQVFGCLYRTTITGAKIGSLRNLGWGGKIDSNYANCTKWENRKPLGYFSYRAVAPRANKWAGAITATTETVSWTARIDNGGSPNAAAGLVMTVSAVSAGELKTSTYIDTATGVTANRYNIQYQISGTPGGVGVYQLQGGANLNITSEAMSSTVYKYAMNGTGIVSSPPADKDMIQFRAANSACTGTANPTTCTNFTARISTDGGTTYKHMLNTAGGVNMAGSTPFAGYYYTLVYDAVLGGWLSFEYNNANGGINCGPPPEIFVHLNDVMGTSPWIVTPYMGADPLSDFIPSYTTYIRDNYPAMKPDVETPNELWNLAADNTLYARSKSLAYSLIDTAWNTAYNSESFQDSWQGKVGSVVCQAVSQVYNDDRNRYGCIVGVNTNGEGSVVGVPDSKADRRLLSTAYMDQDTGIIPVQAGYIKSPANKWATHIAVHTYWQHGMYGWQQEVPQAYNFFYGNTSQRATAMRNLQDSALSQTYYLNTIAWNALLWNSWNTWATTAPVCPSPCGIKGMKAYEGGHGVTMGGPGTNPAPGPAYYCNSATRPCPTANQIPFGDQWIAIVSTSVAGGTCVLSTSFTTGNASYINNGGNGANTTPGNLISTDSTGGAYIYPGSTVTGTGVAAGTMIQGYAYGGNVQVTNGAQVYYVSPTQRVAPTTLTISGNGALVGMPMTVMHATGGTWNTIIGKTYKVRARTDAAITLENMDGTSFDCSGLGTVSYLVVAYTGSQNWINAFRRAGYYDPGQKDLTIRQYNTFIANGGQRSSQFVMSSVVLNGFIAWGVFVPDLYAQYQDAFSSSSTIAPTTGNNGILTLGGNKDSAKTALTVSSGTYNSTTGVVTINISGLGFWCTGNATGSWNSAGKLKISGATGTGADLNSINGTWDATWVCNSGTSALTQSKQAYYQIAPGLTISSITGGTPEQVGGIWRAGLTLLGSNIPNGVKTVSVASGDGKYPGDTWNITCPSTCPTISTSQAINGAVVGAFPAWDGVTFFNNTATLNFLLKRDLGPAANDNGPAWLDLAG